MEYCSSLCTFGCVYVLLIHVCFFDPLKYIYSRERLRRVLRKKTSAELRIIYIFTSSPLHIHILTYISAHLHIHIHICTSTSLLIFTSSHLHLCSSSSSHIDISAHVHICTSIHLCSSSHPHIYISHLHLSLFFPFSLKAGGGAAGAPRNATLCGDRARRGRETQARARFGPVRRNPLRRSRVSRARNAGEIAFWPARGQPSAQIVRVEGAKCRRECVLDLARATLCGDRACRGREMQARVCFDPVRRNPLRRSCVSRARNAGESAFWPGPAQPSAEIVRVEGAKCRRECVLARSGATLCGDRACRGRKMQARVRFGLSGATLCGGDRACRGCERQARVRFGFIRHSPLRRSCARKARNAGERSEWPVCSTNVVRERAFRSWTQKFGVQM